MPPTRPGRTVALTVGAGAAGAPVTVTVTVARPGRGRDTFLLLLERTDAQWRIKTVTR